MIEVGRKYVFDFDSTLTRVEALDVLAEMTLQGKFNRDDVIHEIQEITNLGLLVLPLFSFCMSSEAVIFRKNFLACSSF